MAVLPGRYSAGLTFGLLAGVSEGSLYGINLAGLALVAEREIQGINLAGLALVVLGDTSWFELNMKCFWSFC